jgi:hypothetical protein
MAAGWSAAWLQQAASSKQQAAQQSVGWMMADANGCMVRSQRVSAISNDAGTFSLSITELTD